jgi:hypothetical protein
MYIKEEVLKFISMCMNWNITPENPLTVEEIYSLYYKDDPDIQEKFQKFIRKNSSINIEAYMSEIGTARGRYLSLTGEEFNGKVDDEFTCEDRIQLEAWILENPDFELYPNILKWYGVVNENPTEEETSWTPVIFPGIN